jgi:HD-GYP domain-containing protein (c-di-GMP phosphodiesterase class II)
MNEVDMRAYYKIRLNSLNSKLPIPFDLYLFIHDHLVLYLRAGDRLSEAKVDKFERHAPDSFYIRTEDRQRYEQYVRDQLASEQLNSQEKAVILKETAFTLVEQLFESPDVTRALEDSKEVINNFIEFMEEEPNSLADLIGLSSHDFYTYNHSLDVCIYSLGLGAVAGYRGAELHELGQGALFHDIGKRNVALEIITKEGPLNDVEWAQMKKHPQFGLKILTEHNASESIKACCLEHHENRIGNGYPQRLEGDEIHPMARIVAITDTYDALTTKRSYNDPMTPTDALNFMREKLSSRFDENLLEAMYSSLFKMKGAKKAG